MIHRRRPVSLGHQTDDFAQGINLRTAEFIGLTAGGAAVQTAEQRLDHVVVPTDRAESAHLVLPEEKPRGSTPAARPNGFRNESPGPNITDGLEDGPVQCRVRFADQLFRVAFGAQVIARRVNGGFQGRYL